mmetsp:Transcript_103786/g.223982  ORF Transcript_103786/g.223982 Transcript_103786/m.223982 type:complete len:436 (+) Transcript_103786:1124-2431(+)
MPPPRRALARRPAPGGRAARGPARPARGHRPGSPGSGDLPPAARKADGPARPRGLRHLGPWPVGRRPAARAGAARGGEARPRGGAALVRRDEQPLRGLGSGHRGRRRRGRRPQPLRPVPGRSVARLLRPDGDRERGGPRRRGSVGVGPVERRRDRPGRGRGHAGRSLGGVRRNGGRGDSAQMEVRAEFSRGRLAREVQGLRRGEVCRPGAARETSGAMVQGAEAGLPRDHRCSPGRARRRLRGLPRVVRLHAARHPAHDAEQASLVADPRRREGGDPGVRDRARGGGPLRRLPRGLRRLAAGREGARPDKEAGAAGRLPLRAGGRHDLDVCGTEQRPPASPGPSRRRHRGGRRAARVPAAGLPHLAVAAARHPDRGPPAAAPEGEQLRAVPQTWVRPLPLRAPGEGRQRSHEPHDAAAHAPRRVQPRAALLRQDR